VAVTVGRKLTVIKMSCINKKKQENDPKISLKLTPELKEDYLQDHPCKFEKGSIELWKLVSVLGEDCDLPIEEQSFSCTQVLFDKEGEHRYLNLCERAMQKQGVAFDQELDVIKKLDCTIVNEDGSTEVKPLFLLIDSEIYHKMDCRHLPEELLNNLL
jgi:hypothetical protein